MVRCREQVGLVPHIGGRHWRAQRAVHRGWPIRALRHRLHVDSQPGMLSTLTRITSTTATFTLVVTPQTYYVAVVDCDGPGGTFTYNIALDTPPANDNFANAAPLDTTATVIADASRQHRIRELTSASCVAPNLAMARTVWYRITPTASAPMTMSSSGSSYTAALVLYQGTSLTGLTEVACTLSQTIFNVTAGRNLLPAGWGLCWRQRNVLPQHANELPTRSARRAESDRWHDRHPHR